MAQGRPDLRTVLFITDEHLLADLLTAVLPGHEYHCVVESNQMLAVERFQRDSPAITILDLGALGAAGLQTLAELRRLDANAAILALVGADAELEATAHSLDVTDVLRRHQDLNELLQRMDEVASGDRRLQLDHSDGEQAADVPVVDEPVTVLVVDDDAGVRRFLERVLSADNYRVLTAADGIEALACLDRESVQLMFLDLRLPRLGGLAVLRRLREQQMPPRTVIISTISDRALVQESMRLGAFDYLRKPLTVDRIRIAATAGVVLERARRRSFWSKWKFRRT